MGYLLFTLTVLFPFILFARTTLMREMVATGWLGRKTGKGLYEYKYVATFELFMMYAGL